VSYNKKCFTTFRRFDVNSEYTRVVVKQYRQVQPVNKTLGERKPSCWYYVLCINYSLDNPLSSLTAGDIRVCYGDSDDQLQIAVYCDGALSDINRELDVCYKITDSWSITIYSKLVTTFCVDVKTELLKFIKFRCKQTTVRHINLEAEIYGQITGQPVSSATVTVRIRTLSVNQQSYQETMILSALH
jgi:hypothetical protein